MNTKSFESGVQQCSMQSNYDLISFSSFATSIHSGHHHEHPAH